MDLRAKRCITAYNNLSSRVMEMKNKETMIFKGLTINLAKIFDKMVDREEAEKKLAKNNFG